MKLFKERISVHFSSVPFFSLSPSVCVKRSFVVYRVLVICSYIFVLFK